MKKRMDVLSVCFDEETMIAITQLTSLEGYRSKGEFVRDCVKRRIGEIAEDILKDRHIAKIRKNGT